MVIVSSGPTNFKIVELIGVMSIDGVEVDIHGLSDHKRDVPRLREICDQAGLEMSAMSVPRRH